MEVTDSRIAAGEFRMEKRTLTIIDTKSQMTEINLGDFGKEQIKIGRSNELCEIVISDNIVSKIHGTFLIRSEHLLYKDCDSSNGTFIGEGDQRYLLNEKSGYIEIYDKSVMRIGNVNEPDKMVLILYRITSEDENWKQYSLNNITASIGRNKDNQIVLKHPGVSARHCFIKKQGMNYVLHDQKSTNGVMVNGRTVLSPIILQDKDLIQILDLQLIFSNQCIYYMDVAEGISLRIQNINKCVGSRRKKQILTNVSCEIKANEFVAIIGGSGAGKTTLMNAISGFDSKFTGNIFCNGINLIEQFQNLKNIIGFVPQQDIIYENLTLRRMLYYTAKMKMPKDTLQAEISQRIDEVLSMVELKEHQHTYIRKLSGGQKKRASIAVELLADPKLFFLDEPTSGLDPGTEKNLMLTLRSLAKGQNKTIVMVTHTTANLHLCDKIIFMGAGGRLCFCGNVNEAKSFYQTDDLVNIYNRIAQNPSLWEKRYSIYRNNNGIYKEKSNSVQNPVGKKKESALRQYLILTLRYGELIINDRPRLCVLLLQPLLIAVLLHLVADKKIFEVYESTKSMMFALSCSGIWIGLFNSIQEICKERVIVKREYMANLRLPGYILSKVTLQALLGLIQSCILTFVFLNLTGKDKKGIFLINFRNEILLTVWLTVLASIAMGLVISSLVRTGDKAMAVAPFVLIVQLLFSGILFTLKGAGKGISYCTVSRWSVEALGSIVKLNKLELKLQADYPMLEHKAEAFFKATGGHVLHSWSILICMTVLFIGISVISLRNIANDSR